MFKRFRSKSATESTASGQLPNPCYASLNVKQLSKLSRAAYDNDLSKLPSLLKKQDINGTDKEQRTALHFAAARGHAEACQLLVDRGANVQAQDSEGCTALHRAVQIGSLETVQQLANTSNMSMLNMQDADGNTALHVAIKNDADHISRTLMEANASVDIPNNEERTALHLACLHQKPGLVSAACQASSNINAADTQGVTPLMISAHQGDDASCQILLSHGADARLKDNANWSAADRARLEKHEGVYQRLKKEEASPTPSAGPSPLPRGQRSPLPIPPKQKTAAVVPITQADSEPESEDSVLSHLKAKQDSDQESDDDFHFSDSDDERVAKPSVRLPPSAVALPVSQADVTNPALKPAQRASQGSALEQEEDPLRDVNLDAYKARQKPIRSASGSVLGHENVVALGASLVGQKLAHVPGTLQEQHEDEEDEDDDKSFSFGDDDDVIESNQESIPGAGTAVLDASAARGPASAPTTTGNTGKTTAHATSAKTGLSMGLAMDWDFSGHDSASESSSAIAGGPAQGSDHVLNQSVEQPSLAWDDDEDDLFGSITAPLESTGGGSLTTGGGSLHKTGSSAELPAAHVEGTMLGGLNESDEMSSEGSPPTSTFVTLVRSAATKGGVSAGTAPKQLHMPQSDNDDDNDFDRDTPTPTKPRTTSASPSPSPSALVSASPSALVSAHVHTPSPAQKSADVGERRQKILQAIEDAKARRVKRSPAASSSQSSPGNDAVPGQRLGLPSAPGSAASASASAIASAPAPRLFSQQEASIKELERENSALKRQCEQLTLAQETLTSQLRGRDATIAKLATEADVTKTQLEQELEAARRKSSRLEKDLKKSRTQAQEPSSSAAESSSAHVQLAQDLATCTLELQNTRKELAAVQRDYAAMMQAQHDAEEAQLREAQHVREAHAAALAKRDAQHSARLEKLQRKHGELRTEADTRVASMQRDLQGTEQARAALESQLRTAEADNARLTSELELLQARVASASADTPSSGHAQLSAAQQKREQDMQDLLDRVTRTHAQQDAEAQAKIAQLEAELEQERQANAKHVRDIERLEDEVAEARQAASDLQHTVDESQRQLEMSLRKTKSRPDTASPTRDATRDTERELRQHVRLLTHELEEEKAMRQTLQQRLRDTDVSRHGHDHSHTHTHAHGRTLRQSHLHESAYADPDLLLQNIEELEEELEELNQRFDGLSQRAREKDMTCVGLEEDLKEARAALRDHQSRLAASEDMARELDVLNKQLEQHSVARQQLASERQVQLDALEEQYAQLQQAAGKTALDLDQALGDVQSLQEELEQRDQVIADDDVLLLQLKDEINRITSEYTTCLQDVESLLNIKETLTTERETLSSQVSLLKTDLSAMQSKLESERGQGETALKLLQEENTSLTQRMSRLQKEQETLHAAVQQTSQLLQEQEQGAAKLRQQRDLLESEFSALQQTSQQQAGDHDTRHRTLLARCDALEEELAIAQQQKQEAHSTLQDQRVHLAAAEEKAYQLEMQADSLKASLAERESDVRSLGIKLDGSQEEVRQLSKALGESRAEMAHVTQRSSELEQSVATLESDKTTLTSQLTRLTSEVEEQRHAVVRLEQHQQQSSTANSSQQQQLTREVEQHKADLAELKLAHVESSKRLELKIGNLEQENTLLQQDLERAHVQREERDRVVATLREELKVQAAAQTHVEEERNVLSQQLADAEREVQGYKSLIDDAQQQIVALEASQRDVILALEQARAQIKALEQRVAELARDNTTLSASLSQAEAQIRTQADVIAERDGHVSALNDGVERIGQHRESVEKLLAEVQATSAERQRTIDRLQGEHERAVSKAEEMRRLWEAEVESRSQVGGKLSTMEQAAATWDAKLQKERQRVAKALQKKAEAEAKLDQIYTRNETMQHRLGKVEAELRGTKQRLQSYESGELRAAAVDTELATLRHSHQEQLARVKQQVEDAKMEAHRRDQSRVAEMKTLHHTLEQDEAKAAALQLDNQRLTRQLEDLENNIRLNYTSNSEVEQIVRQTQSQVKSSMQQTVEQINSALRSDAAARDAMQQHDKMTFESELYKVQSRLNQVSSRLTANASCQSSTWDRPHTERRPLQPLSSLDRQSYHTN